jgi:hypothetical protein
VVRLRGRSSTLFAEVKILRSRCVAGDIWEYGGVLCRFGRISKKTGKVVFYPVEQFKLRSANVLRKACD